MIILIVAGPIVCKPVCPFYRRPEHMQISVMCGNNRAFFWSVGRGHAMKKLPRDMRAAVKHNRHEDDGALAITDHQPVFGVGKCLAA